MGEERSCEWNGGGGGEFMESNANCVQLPEACRLWAEKKATTLFNGSGGHRKAQTALC